VSFEDPLSKGSEAYSERVRYERSGKAKLITVDVFASLCDH